MPIDFDEIAVDPEGEVDVQSPEEGKQKAPSSKQAATGKEEEDAKDKSPSEEQGTVEEEELSQALGFSRTPKDELDSIKKQLSASSKESRWNKRALDAVSALAKSQNLSLSVNKKKNERNEEIPDIVLSTIGEDSSGAGKLDFKFFDLSKDAQDEFLDDPQLLIEHVDGLAQKAYARLQPAGRVLPQASKEAVEAAFGFLSEMELVEGMKKFPKIAANRERIERMFNDPQIPEWLKEGLAKDPEVAIQLANARVNETMERLLSVAARAEKAKELEEKKTNQDANALPSHDGVKSGAPDMEGDSFSEFLM